MNLEGRNKDWSGELKALGFKPGKAFGKLLQWVRDQVHTLDDIRILAVLQKFRDYPENFLDEPELGNIAQ